MNKQILLVEDDPDIGELVRINLQDAGFGTQTSTDGKTGLQAAVDGTFDLVVLDIMLPGIDGLEVCRRLRQAGPDTGDDFSYPPVRSSIRVTVRAA